MVVIVLAQQLIKMYASNKEYIRNLALKGGIFFPQYSRQRNLWEVKEKCNERKRQNCCIAWQKTPTMQHHLAQKPIMLSLYTQ